MQDSPLLWPLLLLPSLAAGQDETSILEGELALRTDYLFRGVSQTDGKPQLRGELAWSHESGFYGGLWVTNTHAGGPGNSLEIDPYIGYAAAIGESRWSYDVGYWHYLYPGAEADLDFGEVYAVVLYERGPLGFETRLWYARNYFGRGFFDDTSSLAYSGVLSYDLGLVEIRARLGEQTFREPVGLPDQDYVYYDVAVSRGWGNLSFELSWHNTSGVRSELASPGDADSRWVLGVTRSF